MIKILLVEDDPLMIRMYQRKLLNDGYEVEVAVNGEEGLLKIRSFDPDLILLDIMMPKLNGLQVLERMKADPALSKIPVIILTNLGGSQEDIERGLELGAVAYLVKSAYRPDQVLAKVKEVLAGYTRSKEVPKVGATDAAQKVKEATSTAEPALETPKAKDVPVSPAQDDVASKIRDLLQKQLPPVEAPTMPKSAKPISTEQANDDLISKLRELLTGQMPLPAALKMPPSPKKNTITKSNGNDLVDELKQLLERQTPLVKAPKASLPPSAEKISKKESKKLSDHDLVEALRKLLEKNK